MFIFKISLQLKLYDVFNNSSFHVTRIHRIQQGLDLGLTSKQRNDFELKCNIQRPLGFLFTNTEDLKHLNNSSF